jgi:hypothetical protein
MSEPEFSEATVLGCKFKFRNADVGAERTVTVPILHAGLVRKAEFLYVIDNSGKLWIEDLDFGYFISPGLKEALQKIGEFDKSLQTKIAKNVFKRKRELGLTVDRWDEFKNCLDLVLVLSFLLLIIYIFL